jgi:natural product precursor
MIKRIGRFYINPINQENTMKTLKIRKKLTLNKETVTKLEGDELKKVKGGNCTCETGCYGCYISYEGRTC